ncbi:MAG: class I SAM-dependent methyltransferase [Candidatus Eisenbacteria bacterium]
MSKLREKCSEIAAIWSPSTTKHLSAILSIEGMTSPAECELLFGLASQVRSGCIVEIGSYRGRSAIALALASKLNAGVPVYAVDPHQPIKRVLRRSFGPRDGAKLLENATRCGVSDLVNPVYLASAMASSDWDKKVSLLFIDGDHKYEEVSRDFRCWEPFVARGGLIVLHDARNPNPGPRMATADALSSGRFKQIGHVDSTVVLMKL